MLNSITIMEMLRKFSSYASLDPRTASNFWPSGHCLQFEGVPRFSHNSNQCSLLQDRVSHRRYFRIRCLLWHKPKAKHQSRVVHIWQHPSPRRYHDWILSWLCRPWKCFPPCCSLRSNSRVFLCQSPKRRSSTFFSTRPHLFHLFERKSQTVSISPRVTDFHRRKCSWWLTNCHWAPIRRWRYWHHCWELIELVNPRILVSSPMR